MPWATDRLRFDLRPSTREILSSGRSILRELHLDRGDRRRLTIHGHRGGNSVIVLAGTLAKLAFTGSDVEVVARRKSIRSHVLAESESFKPRFADHVESWPGGPVGRRGRDATARVDARRITVTMGTRRSASRAPWWRSRRGWRRSRPRRDGAGRMVGPSRSERCLERRTKWAWRGEHAWAHRVQRRSSNSKRTATWCGK